MQSAEGNTGTQVQPTVKVLHPTPKLYLYIQLRGDKGFQDEGRSFDLNSKELQSNVNYKSSAYEKRKALDLGHETSEKHLFI